MSPDFIVGVLIVVVVAVFISIFLRASIRQQSSIDRNELQQNISRQTSDLSNIFSPQLETLTTQQQGHLKELRDELDKQLEAIRKTVDEKLRDELDKRLKSGFANIQGFLSQIDKGLGEMRQMSADVGNLQKVLTNVKTKGNWGELQLEAILEDYLAPGQFEKNIVTIPESTHRVEFAVRIPDVDDQKKTFLPIDAKFPTEAYRKLQNAREEDDKKAVENETKNLKKAIIHEAKEIRRKYVSPPHTSNIGILFLPTEGLYGEVYGIPGVEDELRELGITLAGPITLTVILNAIQLSYRTVALEKRSGEVWDVLSATRTEFSKFGTWLEKIQKKVNTVQNMLDEGGTRTRGMNKALDAVDAYQQQAEEVFSSQVNELANEIEHEDI